MPLKDFISDEGDTKLRGRSAHSSNRSFPERSETFLRIDFSRSIQCARVGGLTGSGNHLDVEPKIIFELPTAI